MLCPNQTTAQNFHLLESEYHDSLKQLVEEFPVGAQLSLGFIQDQHIEFVGYLKDENSLTPIENKDSIFEIGSLTKVFTTSLLCTFLSDGSLTNETKVKKIVSFKSCKGITIEQLANHTSGLPRLPSNIFETATDIDNPYANYTDEDLRDYLEKELVLMSKPGKKCSYSNLGIGLLGYLLSVHADKKYEDLLNERIISPLSLNNTSFDLNHYAQITTPYKSDGTKGKNWEWKSTLCAAGGLKSNVVDMTTFIQALLDDKNSDLQLGLEPTFVVNYEMEMGLGWHIIHLKDATPIYWHNGRSGGYTSSMVVNTINRTGIILLSNQTTIGLDRFTISLMRFLALNENH